MKYDIREYIFGINDFYKMLNVNIYHTFDEYKNLINYVANKTFDII